MSSSKSKIKSVTCTKCKQGFKFKRVSGMTSVVCPHCNAKIRFKRKESRSASSKQPSVDTDQQNVKPPEEDQTLVKPTRLPVPELTVSKTEWPEVDEAEADEPELDNVDVPVVKTRRTRKRFSIDGLQVDDADEPDVIAPELVETSIETPVAGDQDQDEEGSSLNIKVRRRGNRKKLGGKAKPLPSIDSPKLTAHAPVVPEPALGVPAAASISESENDSIGQVEGDADQPEVADLIDLLPPKFLVADIEADENAVVLPTAAGGVQVVGKTEVTVSHGGKTVTLVALDPAELKKVRLIENLVALVIAGIMLAIALWLVL